MDQKRVLQKEVRLRKASFEILKRHGRVRASSGWDSPTWSYRGRPIHFNRRAQGKPVGLTKAAADIARCYAVQLMQKQLTGIYIHSQVRAVGAVAEVVSDNLAEWTDLNRTALDKTLKLFCSQNKSPATRYTYANYIASLLSYLKSIRHTVGRTRTNFLRHSFIWHHNVQNPVNRSTDPSTRQFEEHRRKKLPRNLGVAIGRVRQRILECKEPKPGSYRIRIEALAFCLAQGLRAREIKCLPLTVLDEEDGIPFTRVYTAKGQLDLNTTLKQYSGLVRRLAHQMIAKLPANVELDDMVQAGMIGLNDALGRFDAAQGVMFETFATQRIRGAMLDELRGNDYLSRGTRKQQRSIESAVAKLEQKLGRAPAESEIAKEMGVSLAEYQELLGKVRGTQLVYLEDMAGAEGDSDFLDRHVVDEEANPLAQLQDHRMRAALVEAIKVLPEREQYVMSMYYEHDMNLKEIAAVLEVTESRVCQLHSQSIARLRTKLRAY